METAELAKGFDCISIITTIVDHELVNKFHGIGVKFISTRTIGYDHNMINKTSLSKMKDGVYIINTARGSLINTEDFIEAIENGKVGGAALDVIEQEAGMYYNDLKGQILSNRDLAILKSSPNVIVTPHTAFYTDQAVSDMVENSIKSCILFNENMDNPWIVV